MQNPLSAQIAPTGDFLWDDDEVSFIADILSHLCAQNESQFLLIILPHKFLHQISQNNGSRKDICSVQNNIS